MLPRVLRRALLPLALAQARTLRLRGTGRLLRALQDPYREGESHRELVGPYDDSLLQIDTRSVLEWLVYAHGGHEIGAVRLLRRLAHPGGVVFDVGANVGSFTLPLARQVGPCGQVHAFEPHPEVRERLVRNVALNNLRNVTVRAAAVGAAPGRTSLFGSTTPDRGRSSLRAGRGREERFEVEVETLDAYASAAGLERVDVLKIDVEGAELEVLRGAEAVLRRHRPCVYLEVSGPALAAFDATPAAVAALLRGAGYELWRNDAIERRSPELTAVPDPVGPVRWAYWLAVHPGSVGRR